MATRDLSKLLREMRDDITSLRRAMTKTVGAVVQAFTVAGKLTVGGQLRLTSNSDESPTSTGHPLQIGSGPVLKIDNNQIDVYASEDGGGAAALYIQADTAGGAGGPLQLGGQGGKTGDIRLTSDSRSPMVMSAAIRDRTYLSATSDGTGLLFTTGDGVLGRWDSPKDGAVSYSMASGFSMQEFHMWEMCPGAVIFMAKFQRTGDTITADNFANISDTAVLTVTDTYFTPAGATGMSPMFTGGRDGYNLLGFRYQSNRQLQLISAAFPGQEINAGDSIRVNGVFTIRPY